MTLSQVITALWHKACEFDKIPPESKFVVFSDGNRAAKLYNAAVLRTLQRRAGTGIKVS